MNNIEQNNTADFTNTATPNVANNVTPSGIPAQSQTQAGVTPAVGTVTQSVPQQGPSQDFAEARRLQEELSRANAVANDPEVQKFLADRAAAKAAEEAKQLNVSEEALERFNKIDAYIQQQEALQFENTLKETENSFKAKFDMDDQAFDKFVGHIGQNHPEVAQMLQANPRLDLSPYLASYNPAGYAQFVAGASQQATAQPVTNTAMYVPGHGSQGAAVSQEAQALKEHILNRVKNY